MWSDPDSRAHTIIDEDVPREHLLHDFETVSDVKRDGAATTNRVARGVDAVPPLAR
jgi:hypothetical protein